MWIRTTLWFLVGLLIGLYTFVTGFMGIIVGYVLWLDLRSRPEWVILCVVIMATGLIWLTHLATDTRLLGVMMRRRQHDAHVLRWTRIGDVIAMLASIPVWLGCGYLLFR